jgi:hypothetical protein
VLIDLENRDQSASRQAAPAEGVTFDLKSLLAASAYRPLSIHS